MWAAPKNWVSLVLCPYGRVFIFGDCMMTLMFGNYGFGFSFQGLWYRVQRPGLGS